MTTDATSAATPDSRPRPLLMPALAIASLALTAARMKNDTIFRDAAHHFLRLFDRMMTRFAGIAEDADITEFADTRTARAFMLLGRVAGTFD